MGPPKNAFIFGYFDTSIFGPVVLFSVRFFVIFDTSIFLPDGVYFRCHFSLFFVHLFFARWGLFSVSFFVIFGASIFPLGILFFLFRRIFYTLNLCPAFGAKNLSCRFEDPPVGGRGPRPAYLSSGGPVG